MAIALLRCSRSIPSAAASAKLYQRLLPLPSHIRHQSTLARDHLDNDPLPPTPPAAPQPPPLSVVPTSSLLRALLLHSVTASPALMSLSTKALLSRIDTIDSSPLFKAAIDGTFYKHFCGGSNPSEIASTLATLRSLGFAGIILAYAREVEETDASTQQSPSEQIQSWLDGSLKTISYTAPGDFVGIKYSGAGASVLPLLTSNKRCFENPELSDAIYRICGAAKQRGVRLLMDAEQHVVQEGIDAWSVALMRRFNADPAAPATVYNTYQMYLKRSPAVLRRHRELAEREGWRLGVKMVRGAYLGSDPRHEIWDTKEQTDAAYDGMATELLAGSGRQKVDLVLATHNKSSVANVRRIREEVGENGGVGELSFAQLMGMADELSLALCRERDNGLKCYKYVVWGTTKECVKYLVRRANENRDAVGRTSDNRKACWGEVKRRMLGVWA